MVYDTFSFKLTLPPKSRRIEFCVCYKCEAGEYWDNNDVSALSLSLWRCQKFVECYGLFSLSNFQGRNYSLTNRVMPRQDTSIFFPSHTFSSRNSNNTSNSNNSTSPNSTNTTTTTINGQCSSLSAYSSQYVDPTVDLDTWRHMHPEAHDGPYW